MSGRCRRGYFFRIVGIWRPLAVSDEVVFRKSDYEFMVEKIRLSLQQKGQISLAEVRDLFKTSRRYVQALLEHLDATGMTVRSGDFRKLRKER